MDGTMQTIVDALNNALANLIANAAQLVPNLASALLILVVGWIVAAIAGKVSYRLLTAVRVDLFAERRGVTSSLHELGLELTPSRLVSRTIYWVILALFVVPALEALRLSYVSRLLGQLVAALPNLVVALLIVVLGLAIARALGGSVAASVRNAGLEYGQAMGALARYFITIVAGILALAQLGVQTAILTNIFTVLIVSLGLALALALGLGSRPVVSNILAGAFAREHFPVGRIIQVQGIAGTVVEVGSVGTTIESDGKLVTVPNILLVENVVE